MKLDLATMDLARSLEQPAFHDSGVASSVTMMFRSLNFPPISHANTDAICSLLQLDTTRGWTIMLTT
jgi:hypothetical protein